MGMTVVRFIESYWSCGIDFVYAQTLCHIVYLIGFDRLVLSAAVLTKVLM